MSVPGIGIAIDHALALYGLPLAAVMLFAAGLGLPTGVPVKLVVLLAGALCIGSVTALIAAIAGLTLAEVAGATALIVAVHGGAARLLARVGGDAGIGERLQRLRDRLGGHDTAAICLLRLIPGVRYYVPIGAGVIGIPTRVFVLGAWPASLFWVALLLSAGYVFHSDVAALTKRYEAAIPWLTVAGIAVAVAIGVIAALRRRANQDRVDAAPTPPAIADSDPATGFGKP
jgi:membrane protein DedA with SNARE-associated domain